MARGFMRVVYCGTAGRDAVVKALPGTDRLVCEVSLATNESWIDKPSGERRERVNWTPIRIFGKGVAEAAGRAIVAGSVVAGAGDLVTDQYKDKDGNNRYFTYVNAEKWEVVGGKRGGGAAVPPSASEGGEGAGSADSPAFDPLSIPF